MGAGSTPLAPRRASSPRAGLVTPSSSPIPGNAEGERGGLTVRDPFHDLSWPHSGTSTRAPLLPPKHPLLLVQPLALPQAGPACSDVQQQQNVKTEAGNSPRMFPKRRPWCCGTSPGRWWHGVLGTGHLHEATHVSHRDALHRAPHVRQPKRRVQGLLSAWTSPGQLHSEQHPGRRPRASNSSLFDKEMRRRR